MFSNSTNAAVPGEVHRVAAAAPRPPVEFVSRRRNVIEHRFAKQLDLLHLVIGRCGQPLTGLCLDYSLRAVVLGGAEISNLPAGISKPHPTACKVPIRSA